MKTKFTGAVVVLVLLVLAFGVVGQAAAAGSTQAIIKDAQNGTLDQNWTAAQVRAALAFVANNPVYSQYSDTKGVLQDYLASLQAPGAQSGQLAFTGSNLVLVLAVGAGLAGAGFMLRRRTA